MKRIISIIVALVALTGIANAQLTIKKSDVGKAKQLTTLSMSWSWLYQSSDNDYYIVMKSDNQFDDDFWLRLGSNQEECVKSLLSLFDLADEIGDDDRYEIDNGREETFTITSYRPMGMKGLHFHGDRHAGAAYILSSNIEKALKWTQKNIK